jgi:hypothetical protein
MTEYIYPTTKAKQVYVVPKSSGLVSQMQTLDPPGDKCCPLTMVGTAMVIPRGEVWCHTHSGEDGPQRMPVSVSSGHRD